jgi:hypothetical protein
MTSVRRSGVLCVPLVIAAMASAYAQQQESVASPSPQAPPKQVEAPYLLEDGGISVEPFYWLTTIPPALPAMRGGAASSYSNADLNFPGVIRDSPGMVASIPAGRQNTVRISYFRTLGHGDEAAPSDLVLLGTTFSQGWWLVTDHRIQDVKVSWDFLTYPLTPGPTRLRIKTLWEAQWLWIHSDIDAPYAPVTTSSSGTTSNYGSMTKNIIFPTLGGELEQAPFRHFRYEVKASGFGIPHHADIWEAEGAVALRFGKVELLVGEKAFHYKTSPKSDEYFAETLSGPYAGLRWYLTRPE